MNLDNIKLKLGITDDSEDNLLTVLLSDAMNYMMVYFNGQVPTELQFIAEDVAIKRYRRIGAEGIVTEKVDVLSTTYETGKDDFAEYLNIMKTYKNKSGKGFRFI